MERYSPTKVKRSILSSTNGTWVETETYVDATVRSNGNDGITRCPQVMLRAYSEDVNFLDTDYPEEYNIDADGWLKDVDGDIALKRVMGLVLNHDSLGHGSEIFYVVVGSDEKGKFDGWNNWSGEYRIEQWSVSLS